MNKYESSLVCIEGLDRSGKTTLFNKLKEELPENEWVFTQEPSDRKYGQVAGEFLSDNDEPSPADFYLFLADRYDHCENVIKPALEEGKNVLCDRYHMSTYAYQSRVLDEQLDVIDPFDYIEEMTGHFVIEPDLTLYVDISVDESISRMEDEVEKYENRDRLEEAKRVYNWMIREQDNVEILSGAVKPESILKGSLFFINEI